ncbi:MAG: hypothetical protein BWY84_01124 [Candidatus Aerophobetes bacterium ADurb.Bin490]|nr:MAG: hypothetical protein BWY84_01124 [Candidatus Aerophobetes bacterium ADurb.Bin490]
MAPIKLPAVDTAKIKPADFPAPSSDEAYFTESGDTAPKKNKHGANSAAEAKITPAFAPIKSENCSTGFLYTIINAVRKAANKVTP